MNQRPDPDHLLNKIQQAESENQRGKLKIFLGYAAGVGKTFAMLEAAQQRRAEGVDVVVGYIETHGRVETEALLEKLEIVPRRQQVYRDVLLTEMDTDAILLLPHSRTRLRQCEPLPAPWRSFHRDSGADCQS